MDVNGSITCTTPCTLNVSSAYFGAKHTAFSSRVDQPLSIRLSEGRLYLPKDAVQLTSGRTCWRSFDGRIPSNTISSIRIISILDSILSRRSRARAIFPTEKTEFQMNMVPREHLGQSKLFKIFPVDRGGTDCQWKWQRLFHYGRWPHRYKCACRWQPAIGNDNYVYWQGITKQQYLCGSGS